MKKIKHLYLILTMFTCLFAAPDKQMSLDDVHIYYAEKDEKIAKISLEIVQAQHERLLKRYGLAPKTIHIHIADDQKTYNRYSGSGSPAWSVGLASHDKMLVKSPSFSRQSLSDFQQTLLHETVHLALAGIPLPVWFNEGFAQYEAGQFDLRQRIRVSRAFWRNDLEWASEIQYLNQMNHDKATVVYAQCSAMMDFMIDYFSIGLVGKCLQYTREFDDFEKGFKNAFLMDTRSFEMLFREKAKKRYQFYILLDQSNIWILAPFILILGFILTKIRRRKAMASWEEEDQESDPDL